MDTLPQGWPNLLASQHQRCQHSLATDSGATLCLPSQVHHISPLLTHPLKPLLLLRPVLQAQLQAIYARVILPSHLAAGRQSCTGVCIGMHTLSMTPVLRQQATVCCAQSLYPLKLTLHLQNLPFVKTSCC